VIFPIFDGFIAFYRAPVTWCLFFINIFVHVYTYTDSERIQTSIEQELRNEVFGSTQGFVFAKYIEAHKGRYPANIDYLANRALYSGDKDKRRHLGSMAMRDTDFLNEASTFEVKGDQIAIEWWRNKFKHLTSLFGEHPSYHLGVTSSENGFSRWITYQFTHSDTNHIVGNMIFFLIFASSLELIIGGLGILVVYLLSGIFSAIIFLNFSEASAIPLIGASGAVSGIMALFCILCWDRGVRYVFFLLVPKRGFAGIIYLPAWITLILWFLSDVAGHWSTPSEFGGVAYSAHLGGELCGILIGLILLAVRRAQGQPLLPEQIPIQTKKIFTRYV
jgi:membrane associated rhomboid family serine protease